MTGDRGDVIEPQEDVLDTGTPSRPGWWVAGAAAVALALVGWNVLGSGPDEAVDRAAESHPAERPTGWVAQPDPEVTSSPDRVDQLTFVDEEHGFLVQHLCSQASGGAPCVRRVLATTDGGSSWESRGTIPSFAGSFYPFLATSEIDLALIDFQGFTSVARSVDGGRSWQLLPIVRAEPAAVPVGAPLIQDLDPLCPSECPALLSWFDPAGQELHPLPSQPAARQDTGTIQFPVPASMGPDGTIAVASVADSAGLISVSTDGGQNWADSRLEVSLRPGQSIGHVSAFAAGEGRAYAFVQVFDDRGVVASYGSRTDDGGLNWTDLGFEDKGIWLPTGVLDGELISTDLSGQILMSTAGGTRWAVAGEVEGGPYLWQAAPDQPVLAAVPNSQGNESYYLSTNGRTWAPVTLPEV